MSRSREDEQTPLLSSETVERGRQVARSWLPAAIRNYIRSSSRGESSGVDGTQDNGYDHVLLQRQRQRLNSYPTVAEPDPPKKKPRDRRDSQENADGDGGGENGTDEESGDDEEPESRFVGISKGRFWLIFLTVLLGYFVACFDITLMASTHPVITSYFNASESASWLTTVFMITNTGFQPLWGRLSDTVGRKSVYMIVLTIFALTNLWCGLSNSIGSFIAARAVCGLGAGGTMSMGLVITNDLVRIEYRGVYISHINVAFGIGSACGAAFGGVLCDSIGWRWTFGLQVPVIILCGIAGWFTTPKNLGPMLVKQKSEDSNENPGWRALKNFDHLGIVTLVIAVTCIILFLNLGGNLYPWVSPVVLTSLALGVVFSVALIFVEKRAKQPVMPLHLLVKPPTANLVFSNFLAGIASNTALFNVPLWFQAVNLETPSQSGLHLVAPSFGGSVAGILTGYIITYTRRLKPMLVTGALVYLAGSIMLAAIQRDFGDALSTFLITPCPSSQGFIYPGTMMSAFAISATSDQAVVTTTISLWRNLGIVVGVAVSSLVLQNMLRVKLDEIVHGDEAERYKRMARSSVRSIVDMPKFYRDQVIESYAQALKLSFLTAVVASVLLLILVLLCRLPRLRKKGGPSGSAAE